MVLSRSCPDLFWRIERGVELTDKGDDWNKAIELYQAIDEDESREDSAAARRVSASQQFVQRSCRRGRFLHGRQSGVPVVSTLQA